MTAKKQLLILVGLTIGIASIFSLFNIVTFKEYNESLLILLALAVYRYFLTRTAERKDIIINDLENEISQTHSYYKARIEREVSEARLLVESYKDVKEYIENKEVPVLTEHIKSKVVKKLKVK